MTSIKLHDAIKVPVYFQITVFLYSKYVVNVHVILFRGDMFSFVTKLGLCEQEIINRSD